MTPSPQSLSDTIKAELSPRDPPSRDCCHKAPTLEMTKAFEQFNRGEYWEQHETLEGVWRAEPDPSIRNLYKGVIQVGVGFFHLVNHNYIGVMKVLARGINYLKPYSPECFGLDIARLIQEASVVYLRVKDLGPERMGEIDPAGLPRIHSLANGD